MEKIVVTSVQDMDFLKTAIHSGDEIPYLPFWEVWKFLLPLLPMLILPVVFP